MLKDRAYAIRPHYNWSHVYAYSKYFTPYSTKLVDRIPNSMDFIEYGMLESHTSARRAIRHSNGNSDNNSCLDSTTKRNAEICYSHTGTAVGAHYSCGFVFLR